MFQFFDPKYLSKMFLYLVHEILNHFSLFTSIYLLIKSTIVISKRAVLLELSQPFLIYVDISSFHFYCFIAFVAFIRDISVFTFGFLFSFNLYLCKLSWCFFFFFLPSKNVFSLPRSLLSCLTWLSALLSTEVVSSYLLF